MSERGNYLISRERLTLNAPLPLDFKAISITIRLEGVRPMPYYHFYGYTGEEPADEATDSTSSGGFEYESMSAQFNSGALRGVAAEALQLLLAKGVTEMRVRYDGGSDEGFAHTDDMWINGERYSADDIAASLAVPANAHAIQAAADMPRGTYWHNGSAHYRNSELRKVISDALDELSHEIASQLLGQGYGTGEYELYGAATVVFETGQIIDDPAAQQP